MYHHMALPAWSGNFNMATSSLCHEHDLSLNVSILIGASHGCIEFAAILDRVPVL